MRYFAHFLIASLLLAGVFAGYNWWIDPYWIYRDTVEADKPYKVMNERIFKTVRLARQPADIIFMGSSRVALGFDGDQPALRGRRLQSLATLSQRIQETRRLFEVSVRAGNKGPFVLGLDYFAFNALNPPPSDYVSQNYDSQRPLQLLLSVSALFDAVSKQRNPVIPPSGCCHANGIHVDPSLESFKGNYRHLFDANERSFLVEKYLPYPACSFSYAYPSGEGSTLDEMRAIFELAQREGVDLRVFISPAHARQWETLAAAGLWRDWEGWKRELVAMNRQAAERAGHAPFPLWDFSGYDAVSTETVPADASRENMRGYFDSSHFLPVIGRRVVSRMFGADDAWGGRIDTGDIELHLAAIRSARKQYRTAHQAEVAGIEALARQVAAEKHCQPAQGKPE